MAKPVLLLVDDEPEFLRSLRAALEAEYEVRCARSRVEAFSLLSPAPDVALIDLRLNDEDAANREGLTLLQELRAHFPYLPILMITAYGDMRVAVEAMKQGASDFLEKPLDLVELRARLAAALENSRARQQVALLEADLRRLDPRELIGESEAMREVRRWIDVVAQDGKVTVLITGETGTGKELVARAIHKRGARRSRPFVAVALAAIPSPMTETELFGYEAGAFTDARERRAGYIEAAHGGVLFLDEIGEIDLAVQAKLLRFLEERTFQRLGSTQPVQADVQVIAATNADLAQRVREGRFREDLYYRLKVCEIHLPPLRERREDIPLLVHHFLRLQRQHGRQVEKVSREAMQALQQYSWPGNIRQLKNFLEVSALQAHLHGRTSIELSDLPRELFEIRKPTELLPAHDEKPLDVHEAAARAELQCVEEALQKVHGKKTEAWKLLGYANRFTFTRRVRAILEKFPHLKQEFPLIASKF